VGRKHGAWRGLAAHGREPSHRPHRARHRCGASVSQPVSPERYLSPTRLVLYVFPLLDEKEFFSDWTNYADWISSLSLSPSVKGFLNLMGVIVMHTLSDVNAILWLTGNQHISCTKRVNKSVILFPLIPLCGMAGKSKLAIRESNPAPERAANSPVGAWGWDCQVSRRLRGPYLQTPCSLLSLARLRFTGARSGSDLLPPAPAPARGLQGSSKSGNPLPTERGRNVLRNLTVLVPQSPPEEPVSNVKPRGLCEAGG